jgi:hypothetical protein
MWVYINFYTKFKTPNKANICPFTMSLKRSHYDATLKLKAIMHAAEHENRTAAPKCAVGEADVGHWKKDRALLCKTT